MQTLLSKLQATIDAERLSLHMPGHKYRALHTADWYAYDTTEITGTDNLFDATGVLKQSMEAIAHLYDAQASRLLINGSTVGLMAAILALTTRGDSILVARDAHKAIFNAAELWQLNTYTVYPRIVNSVATGYDVDVILQVLQTHPDIRVVVLTSPTYYGYTTPVSRLLPVLAARGGHLIVDEAHGAHLNFCQFGRSALASGAHIVVQSAHKMLAALTQSALLHYHHAVTAETMAAVDHYLELLQSSSPSYLLMSSIDLAVADMAAKRREHLAFEAQLKTFIDVHFSDWLIQPRADDIFKVWLQTAPHGYSGFDMARRLEQSGIVPELANDWGVLLYFSHYNTLDDARAVATVLASIAKKPPYQAVAIPFAPTTKWLPVHENRTTLSVALTDAVGHYSAESIIPYPPGIRLLMAGECILQEHVDLLIRLRQANHHIIGASDRSLQTLRVYQE